jgi:GNAT superfamily N-acetyltransferase
VVSADGSHIEPDRHGPAVCYLLNLGGAAIRYGRAPHARLASTPLLGYRHEDLHISGGGVEVPVQDRVLALKRHVEEMRFLSRLALESGREAPVVAIADGTLLVSAWGQGDDSQVLDVLVSQFLECLEELRTHGVAVASYISRPRGSDVANLLRLAACPYGNVECSTRCRGVPASAAPCASLSAVADRQVFELLPLGPGERSAVFVSSWATSQQRYGRHKVRFFYLHVGSEIARVEVPEWVAEDAAALDLTQAVIVDQAARGQGYPRALIEAHEKAVLSGSDRRAYTAMVEQALSAAGVRVGSSLKGISKSVGQY